MGAEGTLNPENADKFDEWSTVAQVYEAIEKIGLEWMGKIYPSASDEIKKEIDNGTYFHDRIRAIFGHSMGGWIVTQMFLLNYNPEARPDFKLSDHYQFNIEDKSPDDPNPYKRTDDDNHKKTRNLFPNAIFIPIAPIIIGASLSEEFFQNLKNHVPLLTNLYGQLIRFINLLKKRNFDNARQMLVKIGEFSQLINLVLKHFIGNAFAAQDIIANHILGIEDPDFTLRCSVNLDKIPLIINNSANLSPIELLNKLLFFVGFKDPVLNPDQMIETIKKLIQSINPTYNDISPLTIESKNSPHYPDFQGWKSMFIKLYTMLKTAAKQA